MVMRIMQFNGKKNLIHMQLQLMRVRRGLSQSELAAQMQALGANIDQQAISNIENNKRVVTDFELACFCSILRCTERELLRDYYEKFGYHQGADILF